MQAETGKPLEVCEHGSWTAPIRSCRRRADAGICRRRSESGSLSSPGNGPSAAFEPSTQQGFEVANQITNGAGHAIAPFDAQNCKPAAEVLAALGLADQMASLLEDFEVELKAVCSTL